MRAHLMTYIVGARTANGEQIGLVVSTKLFAFNGSLGEVERQRIAERRIPYYIIAVLLVQHRKVEGQNRLHALLYPVLVFGFVGSAFGVRSLVVECIPLL